VSVLVWASWGGNLRRGEPTCHGGGGKTTYILVAFASAEAELLRIVPDEGDALARVPVNPASGQPRVLYSSHPVSHGLSDTWIARVSRTKGIGGLRAGVRRAKGQRRGGKKLLTPGESRSSTSQFAPCWLSADAVLGSTRRLLLAVVWHSEVEPRNFTFHYRQGTCGLRGTKPELSDADRLNSSRGGKQSDRGPAFLHGLCTCSDFT
jgi:hypothetical protein